MCMTKFQPFFYQTIIRPTDLKLFSLLNQVHIICNILTVRCSFGVNIQINRKAVQVLCNNSVILAQIALGPHICVDISERKIIL